MHYSEFQQLYLFLWQDYIYEDILIYILSAYGTYEDLPQKHLFTYTSFIWR